MRKNIIIPAILALAVLTGCKGDSNVPGTTDTNATVPDTTANDIDKYYVTERKTLEGTDHTYEAVCRIFDKNGNTKREFVDQRGNEFEVYFAEENVIAVSNQAGTGIGTRWYEFYDIENDVWSDSYIGYVDVKDGLICHQDELYTVTVERLFGDGEVLYEFDSFDPPMATNIAETAVQKLEFTENGVLVEYMTGEDYTIVSQVFEFNK